MCLRDFDGPEVCEFFYIEFVRTAIRSENIALYRDDGLSIFKTCSGLQMENIKKLLQKVVKNNGLDVIIEFI